MEKSVVGKCYFSRLLAICEETLDGCEGAVLRLFEEAYCVV
jgi:hypothetical protein